MTGDKPQAGAYKCPLCGSELSRAHFHRVMRLHKVQQSDLAKYKQQADAAKAQIQKMRANRKKELQTAKSEATLAERNKSAIRLKRVSARIKKLEEENKMLKKHTSPQEIGLADEGKLVARLKREFPDDFVQHKGKGGDVLHHVNFKGDVVGCIVYECKHTDRISTDHVQQTVLAKKTRRADYAILVTTGSRRGFNGLDQDCGILVVAQAAVLTLARLCRESLIAMAKQQMDLDAKQAAAKQLMDYVTSPVCRTPLEDAISQTKRAHQNLIKEIKQHFDAWKKRHAIYETIHYDVSHVQNNIERVLAGDEPLRLDQPERKPLALPAMTGNN